MKTCIKCKNSNSEYPKRGGNICKQCLQKYRKEYHLKNKEKCNLKMRELYQKNKEKFLKRNNKYYHSINGKILSILNTTKRRAKRKNWEFNLTKEWLYKQLEKQNYSCLITQLPFDFSKGKKYINPYMPSLDRINTDKGYTIDNVRIICTILNLALNEFGEENFKKICKAYLNINCVS